MASIDERVLAMRFDNAQFESAIKSTLSYLDKLKSSLKLGGNASSEFGKIETAAKNVSFQDLYNSVEQVSSRFSTLGIVGMTALTNITNTAVDTGKKIVSSLLDPLIAGGKRRALNIEQAKFQIKGLGYAWEDVSDDINYAVDGTAYGLDVAAKAASQLLASNVAVGDSMKSALRGISGVAAMTSSEYEDIANVFTTVAGNGRLMANELNRISSRGLNAAAALGKYLGVSEAEVREMTSKGQIDFQTFANAMDAAFGEHAKKANDTFTGALSNMKAALSRIGAEFATPSYEMLRNVFLSLTQVINGVKDAMKPVIETFAKGTTIVTDFVKAILPVTEDNATRNKIAQALAGPMEQVNRIFTAAGASLANIAKIIGNIVIPIFQSFSEVLGTRLLSIIADALEVFEHFTSQLLFTDKMTENLKKTFDGIFTIISSIVTVLAKLIGFVAQPLMSAFAKVFGFVADIVLSITGHIGELVVKAHDFISELSQMDTVQFIFSTFRNVLNGIREALYFAYNGVRNFAGSLIDTAFAGATVVFSKMSDAIRFVVGMLDKAVTAVRDFVKYIWELPYVQEFISNAKSSFKAFGSTVVDTAVALKDKFVDAFHNAKEVVGSYIGTIRELIGQYIQLPTFQEVVSNLQNFITAAFEKSQEIFKKVAEILSKVFDRIKEINEVSFKTIIENFGNLKKIIIETIQSAKPLETIVNIFFAVKDGIANAIKSTGGVLGLAKAQLSEFIEWIKSKFGNISLGDVIAAGVGVSVIPLLYNLTKLVNSFNGIAEAAGEFVGNISKITKSIAGLFKEMRNVVKAKANTMYMTAISEIIKSIALLGAAVALLAAMDPARVKSSAIALGVLAGAMIAMIAVTNKLSSGTSAVDTVQTISSMITVAASMLILSIALKQLGTMKIDQIVTSIVALGLAMTEMAAFVIIIDRLAPNMEKASISFIAMGAALLLMSIAITRLKSIDPVSLLTSLAIIGILIKFLSLAGTIDAKGTWQTAGQLLAVAAAILIMIRAIKSISKMNPASLIGGLVGMLSLIGVVILVLNSLGKAGEFAARAGAAVLLISISMHLMVSALKKMSEIDPGTITRASYALTSILGIFALLIASTNLSGQYAIRAGVSILAMSGAMIIMAGAIAVLSKIDPAGLERATQAVQGIMIIFSLVIASTSVIKQADKTLMMIAITIGALAASLAILSLIEPNNLLAASTALTMVMSMFALIVASTSLIQKSKATIFIMLGVIAGLAGVIFALAQLDVSSVIGIAVSLSTLLVSISASALILSTISPLATAAIPAIAAMIGMVAAIAALLVTIGGLVAMIPGALDFIKNGIPVLEAIGTAIGSFVGGIVGGFLGSASNGLIQLGENLATFSNSFMIFLSTMSLIDDSAMKGIDSLIAIITALTVSNFVDALSNLLTGFGIFKGNVFDELEDGLPKFAEVLKEFGEKMKDADVDTISKSAEAVRALIDAFSNMPTEGFSLKGLLFGNADLKAFSENMVPFGNALKDYGNIVKDVDTNAIVNSMDGAKALVELANSLPSDGGAIGAIFGGNSDLGAFSKQMTEFGAGIVSYSKTVSAEGAINTGAIATSVEASRGLVDIAKSLGDIILNDFWTGNKLENFATGIKLFGDGLTAYSESVSGNVIDSSAISNSVEASRGLVDIAKSISEMVLKDFWTGNKLENFATGIKSFGSGLKEYSDSISGANSIDNDAISDSIEGAKGLAEIAKILSEITIHDFWTGNKFSHFAEGIKSFGNGLKAYSDSISGENSIDNSSIKDSIEGARGLADLAQILASSEVDIPDSLFKDLPNLGKAVKEYSSSIVDIDFGPLQTSIEPISMLLNSFNGLDINQYSINSINKWLPTLADSLKAFCEKVVGLNFEIVKQSISVFGDLKNSLVDFPEVDLSSLTAFADAMTKLGSLSIENLSQGFTDSSGSAIEACNSFMSNIVSAMQTAASNNQSQFQTMGTELFDKFAAGIDEAVNTVNSSVKSLMQSVLSTAKEYYTDFKDSGNYLMSGMAEGIQNGTSSVVTAIRTAAKAAVEAANSELDINSPSKVFKTIGEYMSEGWGIGIISKRNNIITAITDTAKLSKETAMDQLGTNLSDSLNFDPTITPVIDLSKLDKGLDYIDSKFDKFSNLDLALSGQIASLSALNKPNVEAFDTSNQPVNLTQNFAFNQTNNSPKALSNIDIYRQTNNQFTRFAAAQHARVVPQSI